MVMALVINGLRSWKDCAILQGPYGNLKVLSAFKDMGEVSVK